MQKKKKSFLGEILSPFKCVHRSSRISETETYGLMISLVPKFLVEKTCKSLITQFRFYATFDDY